MKQKILFPILIIMLVATNTLVYANQANITTNQKTHLQNFDQSSSSAPEWPVGTTWSYRVRFSLDAIDENNDISLYVTLNNLNCEVIQNESIYLLKVSSLISGSFSFDVKDGPQFSGSLRNTNLNGFVKIEKDDISLKEINVDISGQISVNIIRVNLGIDALIHYNGSVTPLHFPLQPRSNWTINSTNFTITGEIELPGITKLIPSVPNEFNVDEIVQSNEKNASCISYDNISTFAGFYPSYLIQINNDTDYFYSPVIGNFAKIFFGKEESDSFQYELVADLRSTNYIMPGAPNTPNVPIGTTSGEPNQPYNYTVNTTDPENDSIYYSFDWGDDTISSWIGPVPSGESITVSKTWVEEGSYSVFVKAKDEQGNESPWSDPLPVSMPKIKQKNLFITLFERILQRFPILENGVNPQ